MRIVEPQKYHVKNRAKKSRKKLPRKFLVFPVVVIFFVTTWLFIDINRTSTDSSDNIAQNQSMIGTPINTNEPVIVEDTSVPRILSGNEFRLLYDNIILPNTTRIDAPPAITGNDIADARIRQLAEIRGYKLRRVSSTELQLRNGYLLHEIVHTQWNKLQSTASNAGLNMAVVSSFRSVEDQRILFNARIQAEGISVSDIAVGTADEEINNVLATTAVPGYSKHHSGYAIDLLCSGWEFENFVNSSCYKWLSADNYSQAKLFGFIPSYPTDADLQGPDPEAWEYVFVGVDILN